MVAGLDLFAEFNLHLSFLPHWNNTDGGDEVDTSRCFAGVERFNQWCRLLPAGHTTIGLDEHTGMIIDFVTGRCSISGVSSVTLLRASNSLIFPAGADFPITELGEFHAQDNPETGNPSRAWKKVLSVAQGVEQEGAPTEVAVLLEKRQQARLQQRWVEADTVRQQLAALGWLVEDTPEGQKIVRQA